MERAPTVAQRIARHDVSSRREIDTVMTKPGTMPQILCWKCRKLTPFELDRCQHCGSAFAGSTGGAYGSGRPLARHTRSVSRGASTPPKRGLLQIVDDLRRVRDASASRRGRPREKQDSLNLYQCPSCGRFVSEQAMECACGVRFAPMSAVTFVCPDCGSRVPSDVEVCPVCRVEFTAPGTLQNLVYACPRCGVHVASDAVRCACGAWFED